MAWGIVQTTLDALLNHAGLGDYLKSFRDNYTLFAPQNAAWDAAFYKESLDCTTDYYVTSTCDSMEDLLTATNLKDILLNHGVSHQSLSLVAPSDNSPSSICSGCGFLT